MLLFFAVRCCRSEATVGSQSDDVFWKPLCVGERPCRIHQPQLDGPRHRAHPQQLLPWSVKYCDSRLLLKQDVVLFHKWLLCSDYPYCLAGNELRAVIKGLLGRCTDILPDLFDHCIYTMLRELDKQTGISCSADHTWVLFRSPDWLLSLCLFFFPQDCHNCRQDWQKGS